MCYDNKRVYIYVYVCMCVLHVLHVYNRFGSNNLKIQTRGCVHSGPDMLDDSEIQTSSFSANLMVIQTQIPVNSCEYLSCLFISFVHINSLFLVRVHFICFIYLVGYR